MDVDVTNRPSPVRCAVCHDALASEPRACDGCGTVLHPECRDPVHGCPTLGCRHRVVPETDEQRAARELRRARRLGFAATVNGAAALHVAWLCHRLLDRAPPEASLTAFPVLAAFGGSALLGALTLLSAVRVWRRSWLGVLALCAATAWLVATGSQLGVLLAWARPITEAEAREHADRIDRGHESVFERIDVDALMRREDPLRASMKEEERNDLRVRFRDFQATTAMGLSLKVVRVTTQEPPSITVRLVDRDGGLNYHEYVLARGRDGEPTCSRVRDLRVLDDWFAVMSRLMRASSRRRHELERLLKLVNEDQARAALRVFGKMSPDTKADRDILLVRLRAAQEAGKDEVQALTEVMAATDGESPLLRLELAYARGDDAATLEALDAIDRLVGPDPFLDALRADVKNVEGGSSEALELAKRATAAVPDVEAAWWTLLECAVGVNDHARTRAALEQLVGTFHNEPLDIEETVDLSEFFSSADGEAWLNRP